jgi:hypothetical protein
MKKLYNLFNIKAYLLVIMTSFFAFVANAQDFNIVQTPSADFVGEQDTVRIDTLNLSIDPDTRWLLWRNADGEGGSNFDPDFDDVLDISTAVNDTILAFTWDDDENYDFYVSPTTNFGTSQFLPVTDSDISIGGILIPNRGEGGEWLLNHIGFRSLTTGVFDLSAADTATLTVQIDLDDVSRNDSLLVQYSLNGTAWVDLTDANDSSYFANTYGSLDGESPVFVGGYRTLNFPLPDAAEAATTQFRIIQPERSNYEEFEDEWIVNDDNFEINVGEEFVGSGTFVGSFDVDNPEVEIIQISRTEGSETDTIFSESGGISPASVYPGQTLNILVGVNGYTSADAGALNYAILLDYENAFNDNSISTILEDNDGDGGSLISGTSEIGERDTILIQTTISSDLSLEDLSLLLGGFSFTPITYTGSAPVVGDFLGGLPGDPQIGSDVQVSGGVALGPFVIFNGDSDRSITSRSLSITSVDNATFSAAVFPGSFFEGGSNPIPPGGELSFEYSTDDFSTFTQIGVVDVDTVETDDFDEFNVVFDLSGETDLISDNTRFRIRQLNNRGQDLDVWSLITPTEFRSNGTIEFDNITYESEDTPFVFDLSGISLDPVEVPESLIFSGDDVNLTFDVNDGGVHPDGTEIRAYLLNGDVELLVGTTTTPFTKEGNSITITMPQLPQGQYDVELRAFLPIAEAQQYFLDFDIIDDLNESVITSNPVTIPVSDIFFGNVDVEQDGVPDIGNTDIFYPDDEITITFDYIGPDLDENVIVSFYDAELDSYWQVLYIQPYALSA